jgi:hypothetical protein
MGAAAQWLGRKKIEKKLEGFRSRLTEEFALLTVSPHDAMQCIRSQINDS